TKRVSYTESPREVRLWDLSTGRVMGSPLRIPGWLSHRDFSPDSSLVTLVYPASSRSLEKLIHVFSTATGKALRPPLSVYGPPTFSPGDRLVAQGKGGKYSRLSIVEMATGRVFATLDQYRYYPWKAFSPDNQWLVTVEDRSPQLWKLNQKPT